MPEDGNNPVSAARSFATTHWSVVTAAGNSPNPRSAGALTELCRTYWYPLYVFLRRKGVNAREAQDLTQSFVADLLARNPIARADRRLRTILVLARPAPCR